MKKSIDKQELFSKMSCALTHDLSVCQNCKKCGENAAEIRLTLINELAKLLKKEKPWKGL